jgi:hypothetical protein
VTLALLERPDLYDAATRALNDGLDLSFRRDPIWGLPQPDAIYVDYHAHVSEKRQKRAVPEPALVEKRRKYPAGSDFIALTYDGAATWLRTSPSQSREMIFGCAT